MTILNWLYWKKQQLIKTEANNAKTDLVVLGAEVPFTKRDDGYQDYAMTLADATQAGCSQNNTLETGINQLPPFVCTSALTKGYCKVTDPATGLTLQSWKVEGTIELTGASSYSEYLGTLTIENGVGAIKNSWKVSGAVQSETFLPGVRNIEPLGLFNTVYDTGAGSDYAQFSIVTFPTVVGTNLELDVVLFVGPCPLSSGPTGDYEAVVSFQLESLIESGLNVTFTV